MKLASCISAMLLFIAQPLLAGDAANLPSGPVAWSKPDRELLVPVEGGNVYVRINGEKDGNEAIPAIFIHGGPGGTHAGFAGLLGLADERPVILYDQLGSGKSDRPDNPAHWQIDRYIEELDAVRRASGAEKVHLIGHSWGAAVALEYTAKYPGHVASTALSGTFISAPHWLTDANLMLAEMEPEDRKVVHACESDQRPPLEQCRAAFSKVYSRYYVSPERSEAFMAYVNVYGGQGFNRLIYQAMWGPSEFASTGTLKNYDATLKLLELDGSRTLFVIGQYDSARIDTVQEFVTLATGAELAVVPGGAHGFLIDRPLETEAILRGWLRRMDSK